MARRPDKTWLLRGPDGLDEILSKLKHGTLAVDTETTGLNWRTERVGSINLAAGHTAIFAYKGALAPVARYLSDQVKQHRPLVFHNAKFDLHFLRSTFGLHVPYPVNDTMIMSQLLDNRGATGRSYSVHGGHGLKNLAMAFVDPYGQEPEKKLLMAIKRRGGKSKADWLLAPPSLFAYYSALDPWYTLQLHEQFIQRIRGWAQPEGYPSLMDLYKTERWLTLALRDMEERGIAVHRKFLHDWQLTLEKQLTFSSRRLAKMARGRDVNWNSPIQVRALLYGSRREGGLGLTTERMNKRSTELSTDKNALIKLDHPIGAELLTHRKLSKQHGTYAVGLQRMITEHGVIHTNFNQNVDTGRMSSYEPNLQQEDRTSGVRRAFHPRKGLVLRFADYSQIEMRFAAHFADEKTLIKGFNTDPEFDTHYATAQLMFGVKKPTDEQRGRGKTMNFAVIYGAGEDRVTEGLMMTMPAPEARQACIEMGYTPSRAENPHRTLAKLLRVRYRERMPAMPRAAKREEAVAKGRGFSMTAYGGHRYLDHEREAYKAFNSKIQGSAAHAAKKGLVNVYRELQLGTGELALLLQVHDEIIYESEGNPRTDRKVLELLADTDTFKIPIIADMSGSAISWQDKQKLNLEKKHVRSS